MLSSETVRALGIRGHNYPSKLTPIEMNGSTPFSAGVIVAVCLAADFKASLPWFATRKARNHLFPSLSLFFFLIKGKGMFAFADLWGGEHGGMVKQYNWGLMVLSTYEVFWLWRVGKG